MNPATELPERAKMAARTEPAPAPIRGGNRADLSDCEQCGGYGEISWDVEDEGNVGTDSIPCPRGCRPGDSMEPTCCDEAMVHNTRFGRWECADALFALIENGRLEEWQLGLVDPDTMHPDDRRLYLHLAESYHPCGHPGCDPL